MSQVDQQGKGPVRKLGRGLSALLGSPVQVQVPGAAPSRVISSSNPPKPPQAAVGSNADRAASAELESKPSEVPVSDSLLRQIPVEQVVPNRRQPRTDFSEAALQSLAESIRTAGLMQPIMVRSHLGQYELVAGERRWRAAKLLGMTTIPALVREIDEQTAAELALIENIQREDLNPMERASALKRLALDFGMTHQAIAEKVGLDRASVTNLLRLSELDRSTADLVRTGQLTQGHAKALLGVSNLTQRADLAARVIAHDWSVRELERQVQGLQQRSLKVDETKNIDKKEPSARDANVADLERQLAQYLGTRVHLQLGRKKGSGRLVMDFYNLDQFDGLMQKMGFGGK
ncbi:MAG: ParB/RepB/Spo0J family partition protein [bacterium]